MLHRWAGIAGFFLPLAMFLDAQPPPPPLGPPPRRDLQVEVPSHIARLKVKISGIKPVNGAAERAMTYCWTFLQTAERKTSEKQWFAADRFAGAADAISHVAEHQEHLTRSGIEKGPPPKSAQAAGRGAQQMSNSADLAASGESVVRVFLKRDLKEHLQRTYFRVSQAEFFERQASDQRADDLPKWARDFYQTATRAYDRGDLRGADENAKCAEDVVAALEHLAQADTPGPPPPPPPPGGHPRPGDAPL